MKKKYFVALGYFFEFIQSRDLFNIQRRIIKGGFLNNIKLKKKVYSSSFIRDKGTGEKEYSFFNALSQL